MPLISLNCEPGQLEMQADNMIFAKRSIPLVIHSHYSHYRHYDDSPNCEPENLLKASDQLIIIINVKKVKMKVYVLHLGH